MKNRGEGNFVGMKQVKIGRNIEVSRVDYFFCFTQNALGISDVKLQH